MSLPWWPVEPGQPPAALLWLGRVGFVAAGGGGAGKGGAQTFWLL